MTERRIKILKKKKLISNGNQQSHHSKAQDNDAERDGKEKDQPETTVHDTTTDKTTDKTTDDTTTDNKKKVQLLLQINSKIISIRKKHKTSRE